MSAFFTYWRVLISVLLLSAFGQIAQAQQGTIRGRVTAEGQALEFVSVLLAGTAIGATTGKEGRYQLASVAAGKHEVVFSFLGYDAQRLPVEVAAGQTVEVNVALKPTTSKLGEVVVTGVSRTTKIRRSPIPIAVLGKREMNLNLSTNLIDAAVRGVPGLTAVTTGPNVSKPFIRGLGYNRVLTLYNGLRQEGQQWGDEHGIEVDQYDIERIEVVKGPASLMYGSDAVAGVINMLPAPPSGPVGKLRGDVISEYHTNNGLIGTSLGLSYRQPAWQYAFRASQKTAANYQNSIDGRVYGTAFRELNLSGMVGVEKSWGYSHWYATAYHNQQEIPDGSRDSLSRRFTKQVFESDLDDIKNRPLVTDEGLRSYSIGTLHQLIKHYRLFNRSQVKLGQHELSVLLGAQQNFRYEFNHPTAPKQAGLAVALTTYNYDLHDNLPTWHGVETTIGVNGMAQLNRNRDATDFPIPDYDLFDLGSYVFLKKSLGKLDLSGGARYDARRLAWDDFYVGPNPTTGFDQHVSAHQAAGNEPQFPALNKWFRGVSGSLGATYSLSERLLVKANVARGYRAPNITEVGSNGLDPGAHIVYLGNRSFQPEFSLQQDLGLLAYLPDLDASVEVFHNNIQNYIYQAKLYDASGQPVVIVPGNTTYQYQQAAARLYGLEASLKLHPRAIKWLLFDNSLAFVNGLNQNQPLREQHGRSARYLPFMPPLRTRSELRATVAQPTRWLAQTYVHVGVEAVATQNRFYAVDNTETATPGYALWSLGAGTSFVTKQAKPWLQLFIQLDNVFDKAYQSNLNRLKYFEYYAASPTGRLGIYNMGRNLSVKVIVPFGD
jgi:iron complex outermembrane receptor protein